MRTDQQILKHAYLRLLRKVGLWAGLISIIATNFVAMPASAGQVTARKSVVSSSAAGATATSYDTFFTNATTSAAQGIKSIRFQFCDAATGPLYNTTCTLPTGMVRGTTITTQTNNGAGMTNAFTAATNGTSDVLLTNATGNTFTAAQIINIKLSGFTNPTTVNVQYYVRIITCTDTTCAVGAGSNADNGGIALATTQTISVSANVQENLVFCTGVSGTTCGTLTASGAALSLAPNPMTTASYSTGTSAMIAATNASSGYSITYTSSNANSGSCTGNTGFCDVNSGRLGDDTNGNLASGGNLGVAEKFGLNLATNTYPSSFGAAPSGGTGTAAANYNTANTFSFNQTAPVAIASAAGPTAQTNYNVSYYADVTNTTKPGAYSVNMTYICTGTF